MDFDDHGLDADTLRLLTEHLDASYYAARYEDIRAAGCDAALHYATTGWRERRRPNAWFDTAYYLDSNRDVADAQVNPLWHYLVRGQAEGRAPMRPAALQRGLMDRARPAAEQGSHYAAPADAAMLDEAALLQFLAQACLGAHGLVLSASHDRYTGHIGGTQLLIADEQGKFNGARMAYLHLSPAVARMTLAPPDTEVMLQLVLDGAMLGLAGYDVLAAALAQLDLPDGAARILVVHCLVGHDERGLAQAAALRTTTNLFWVHDYSSLCEGLHLLRNGVANCGAPPLVSMACRVCVHGDSRAAHRERLLWLFGTLAFHVVAPSQSALDLWRSDAGLPHLSARVHAHCRLVPGTRPARTDPAIRVAFIGFATPHKGWPLFERLLEATGGSGEYRYYHFASLEHLVAHAWLTPMPVHVTPDHRLAMIQPLVEHSIDIALVLSPWAETFSFAAHEAIAAGVAVVATAGSGNIAALVRATGRGVVLDGDDALLELFTGNGARALADAAWPDLEPVGGLVHCGTSATLDLRLDNAATLEAMVTADPDLALIVGGGVILPTLEDGRYRFAVPHGAQAGVLVSRACVPALMYPGSTDHRRLGVAVTALALDGAMMPLDDRRHGGGWYAPEHDWRWTDGRAALALDGAAELSLAIVPMLAYWRCPVAAPPPPEKFQHDLFGSSKLQSAGAPDGTASGGRA